MYTQPPALGKCREVQQIRNIRQERPILIWDLGHFGTRVTVTAVSCTYSKSLNYISLKKLIWVIVLFTGGTRRNEREQNGTRGNKTERDRMSSWKYQFLKTVLFKSMFAQGVAVCKIGCFASTVTSWCCIWYLCFHEFWPVVNAGHPGLSDSNMHAHIPWFSRHNIWNILNI